MAVKNEHKREAGSSTRPPMSDRKALSLWYLAGVVVSAAMSGLGVLIGHNATWFFPREGFFHDFWEVLLASAIAVAIGVTATVLMARRWDRRRVERYQVLPLRLKKSCIAAGVVTMPVWFLVVGGVLDGLLAL